MAVTTLSEQQHAQLLTSRDSSDLEVPHARLRLAESLHLRISQVLLNALEYHTSC